MVLTGFSITRCIWRIFGILVLAVILSPVAALKAAEQTPSPPSELNGSIVNGLASVTWKTAADGVDVNGYNIYINNQYSATVQTNRFTHQLQANTVYTLYVVAFNNALNAFSPRSNSITLQDTHSAGSTTPSIPSGLTGHAVKGTVSDAITLSWNASSDDQAVKGYNIYRNTRYIATRFGTDYSGTVQTGTSNVFTVVSFDFDQHFSPASKSLTLQASGGNDDSGAPPSVPTGLTATTTSSSGQSQIQLTWQPPTHSATIKGYNVYRNNAYYTTVFSTHFTDTITSNAQLSYAIVAFDDFGHFSAKSTSVTVATNASSFNVSVPTMAYNLLEGSSNGVNIPVNVSRQAGAHASITLAVEATSSNDNKEIHASFSKETLNENQNQSILNLRLSIGVLPLLPQQRTFTISASDGTQTQTTQLTIAVTPIAKDDVYLIFGQSNMVGSSEPGSKRAGPGEPDAPNPRIRQANVELNQASLYSSAADYTTVQSNFRSPAFVTAEDPLHEPTTLGAPPKPGTRIGMALSFAKTALSATTRNIVLVPAAWGGSGFCKISSTNANWNATATTNPALGNTLLFDRAVARINYALSQSGGILRGILWHQGETDARPECAPSYEHNLVTMISRLRTVIQPDSRGASARGPNANIPFVLGTMSKGNDERGNFSNFSEGKSIVDTVHRNITTLVPFSEVTLNDDLTPANGYPCGNGSCIHFGATALREMGARTYNALVRAAGN